MAHQLEVDVNGKASMAYAGETPWHGLGTSVEEADLYDWRSFCKKSNLDWDAELIQLMTKDTQIPVDYNGVRRSTDGKMLGFVGPRYTVLQNREAFEWFQPFLEAKEASLNTAGALAEGSRIWVLAKLNRDPMVIAAGDEVNKFILLSHSHDGSLAVRVGWIPLRVVCSNTLAMAHSSKASKLIRIKHSRSVHANLNNVREVMNLANQEFEATAEQYRLLAKKSINQNDLRKYVKTVLKIEENDEDASSRSMNQLAEIVKLFETGRGNDLPSVKGSWWIAYNSLAEYLSYNRGHNQESRLNSLWYGDSANMNKFAFETALTMAA